MAVWVLYVSSETSKLVICLQAESGRHHEEHQVISFWSLTLFTQFLMLPDLQHPRANQTRTYQSRKGCFLQPMSSLFSCHQLSIRKLGLVQEILNRRENRCTIPCFLHRFSALMDHHLSVSWVSSKGSDTVQVKTFLPYASSRCQWHQWYFHLTEKEWIQPCH